MDTRVALTAAQKREFMQIALDLSRKALPGCLPNPPVGCVIVRDLQIVASGFTQPPGQPHAEAMALAALKEDLTDCQLFVTLEPCSFFGRTPSCAQAIAESGVSTVFVSLIDPDPRNSGRGLDILKQSGLKLEVGILAEEVSQFLKPHLAFL